MKFTFYKDEKFWKRLAVTMIIGNIILFISWLIAIITLHTAFQVLNVLQKILSVI